MKKIIIDGVDVAGCEQIFAQKKCALLDQVYCEDNPNCYYKQLKQIEQSQDKLYDDLLEVVKPYLSDFTGYDEKEQSFNIVLAVKELLGQLEQENETLNYQWHKQSEIGDEWYKIAEKYKTALEEIKKLTIIGINASQCNCGLRALADDILQIISEVED